ncbi:uncharacterized protein FOMMEDRAFT_114435 [Fomitiporia mediterranea MF3/22]|uniref:uncharacterized protein n=1 Tax=Fomitiporia mediterranea (strain MF3/22) TaxID=694068 RepID=UPI00044083A7|nr:uncharacterized protein FOMMEDRAFT_114435 [Fomitiporia mediterranea MF3/22]EJC98239.1 hypothetical protein FOMMEDRAFT_114435 [Fomitiporia mediterranea MF3/22]
MSANSTSPAPASNPASSVHQNVVPSEVGWQFVPQYYTFVNKQPNRLHCFYTKKSTFIHGTEGEDGRPCYGQQEIHQKILSIGFQDCKVFIHSVDAQASANNGIIIQVIGEMSNRGEAWRKFVQTFFLAEQPNGYFVLNDIFRFLKEESVEDEEAEEAEEPQPEAAPAVSMHVEPEPVITTASAPEPAPVHEPIREPTPEPQPEPEPVPTAVVEEPARPQPNGVRHDAESKEPEPIVEPPAPQEPVREPTPTSAPASVPAAQPSPSPSPAVPAPQPSAAPAVQQQPPAPQQPAQLPQPAAPKTWANLAAANSKKWGSAVAQESRGMSVEAAPAPQPPSRSGTNTPVSASSASGARPGSTQKNGRASHHLYQQALGVTSPHVFVKGLVDPIRNEDLEELLVKYGKIKEIEFVRSSACAFVEYDDVKSAQRAITASLNVNQGGDGGIVYKHDSGESYRVVVETKKERGERPPPRGRGGVPPQGARGNFRGGRGRGRGVPAGKAM